MRSAIRASNGYEDFLPVHDVGHAAPQRRPPQREEEPHPVQARVAHLPRHREIPAKYAVTRIDHDGVHAWK